MSGAAVRGVQGEARFVSATGEFSYPIGEARWRAEDRAHINLAPGRGLRRDEIRKGERSLWRYAGALRVDPARQISLGEGWTPLIEHAVGGQPVRMKLEYLAPSGSFKDRGTAVLLSHLREVGIDRVLEDSSGNAGASLATYAAAANMACRILVPAGTAAGKITQMAAAGAEVVRIEGSRQDVALAALREAEHTFYASHNWQPFFLEGTKTLAFELWEQLGFEPPDAVVVPLGYGSNVLGCWLGFNELKARGETLRLPRIYGVQAANCAPFHAMFEAASASPPRIEVRPTVAEGIASSRPVRVVEVLDALRGSGGGTLAVGEEDIKGALKRLIRAGFFVEPTSACVLAGIDALAHTGAIRPDETVVAVLTGSGMKALDRIQSLIGE
jgi:threonine synthase